MRILFLSSWSPFPANNGSKIRISNLLRALAERHEVSLISFTDDMETTRSPEIDRFLVDAKFVPIRGFNPVGASSLIGLLKPIPRWISSTYDAVMAESIENALSNHRVDVVVASQWNTAAYYDHFRGHPAVFEEVELGSYQSKVDEGKTAFVRLRHTLPLSKMRWYLRKMLPSFKACTVASEHEAAMVRQAAPDYRPIEIVPNFVDIDTFGNLNGSPRENSLIYTGALSYFANHDAMSWFIGEIYPSIRRQVPEARLTITGDHGGRSLPGSESVDLTGLVEDVRPLISSSCVSLAPIRLGGGTRLKVLEAMALRTPVVTTSKGVEGLDVTHNEHLLVADTPQEFSEAVVDLLRTPRLRKRLADSAYELVREKYDYKVVMPKFLNLVEIVASS